MPSGIQFRSLLRTLAPLLLIQIYLASPARAYSVLTHEAIVERSWQDGIQPLLLKRYPETTAQQLQKARAYACGGAVIPDMGYFPLGSRFFSDLIHYTRSGDFIIALLRDAQDVNEYAFALGALSHYVADDVGHATAINRATPMIYPKLQQKYGAEATYEDDPAAHLKTEFAFDVIGVAQGLYGAEASRRAVRFEVSRELLERAFEETYSLPLHGVFHHFSLALGMYRVSVGRIIPEMAKVAWSTRKNEIQRLRAVMPGDNAGNHNGQPGMGTRLLAGLLQIVPKAGPFKALAFKVPPPEAEKLFLASFDETMTRYSALLEEAGENRLKLGNENFDIGRLTQRGDYRMADATYARVLENLAGSAQRISAELRWDILAFYNDSDGPGSVQARTLLSGLRTR